MSRLAVLVALLLAAVPASAQDAHHHHGTAASAAAHTPATTAFREANAQMHREMDIRYSNEVDVDFVRGMIPHHRGAVAMAKVALAHSKDPEVRRLAEEIIAAQDREIAQMEAILKRISAAR